ncbi:hypothetical protein ABZT03_17175 [Streptomyces sp. NPDC005574]|uniref:hypothetical protein n=1 Tax=Streptomyces sp. NPDC005574 TaxID=3156891 RepID=UPI0033B981E8
MSGMVDIRSAHKSYGSREVFRGIGLAVPAGEAVAVRGRSSPGFSEPGSDPVPRARTGRV